MAGLSLNNSQCSSPTLYTHTQCILSCTTGGKQAARGREGARENRRWEGQRKEGGGGSKVMVGEGTRGGRERRKEGGREQGDGGRGNKGRDGEKEGGRE